MNNRDQQIIKKVLSEIYVIEDLIKGFNLEAFWMTRKQSEHAV
jgi:hypothetical protein